MVMMFGQEGGGGGGGGRGFHSKRQIDDSGTKLDTICESSLMYKPVNCK